MRRTRSDPKIQTRHPDPKKRGVRIDATKYNLLRRVILNVLRRRGPLTFTELLRATAMIARGFPGSVSWYFTTVKLDLEARGLLTRVPGTRPQLVRLTPKGRSANL